MNLVKIIFFYYNANNYEIRCYWCYFLKYICIVTYANNNNIYKNAS